MILGVGIDIIKVDRVAKSIKKRAFADIAFTPSELACYTGAGSPLGGLAGRFAVKEAVFKALGTGWIRGTDVEILSDKAGKPIAKLSGETLKASKKLGMKRLEVSMSSYEDYAVGMAIAEK